MKAVQLPAWAERTEDYTPPKDHDDFFIRSALAVLGVLLRLRHRAPLDFAARSAAGRLLFVMGTVLMAACAQNALFLWLVIAVLLARLCFMEGRIIWDILKIPFAALAFSALILLPAVFLGSPRAFAAILAKTFISATLLGWLAQTTPWNVLTDSLRIYRAPHIFIFTLDITLKYIALLGELCLQLLDAFRLRSIGRNQHKSVSFVGVLGVTFLKSREWSEQMHEAMLCRGFDGEYRRPPLGLRELDWSYLPPLGVLVILFFYLEGAVK